LTAKLRLDPCVSLWSGVNTTLWPDVAVNGDVFCSGVLTNTGVIDGDIFASSFLGSSSSKTGQQYATTGLSLAWPQLSIAGFTSHYDIEEISSGSISAQTFGPYEPVHICRRIGNLDLAGKLKSMVCCL